MYHHASTHKCHMHLLLPKRSIITYKIYYLQYPETFKFCLNCDKLIAISNCLMAHCSERGLIQFCQWKKIVEEFYLNTSRFKNIDQSIVIKYRTNYSITKINCSHLDKKWFFILFNASPMAVNFVNSSVCWRGCKWLLSILMGRTQSNRI